MQCPACGQRLADGTKYCPSCGGAVPTYVDRENVQAEYYETEPVHQEDDKAYKNYPKRPMKWYKFLVYVSLLLTGVSNIFSGIRIITGMQYQTLEQGQQIYNLYGALKMVDMCYGVVLIVLGIYAFAIRHWMVRFKKKAPMHLLIMYAVSFVVVIVYLLAVSLVIGVNMIGFETVIQLIVSVTMIFANKVYFDKRKHMFNN